MESSPLNDKAIYDPFRKKWVEKTPEELVRQSLLKRMVQELGYPPASFCLERSLKDMPHLRGSTKLPNRRFDVVCFANGISAEHELYPLLVIECKVDRIDQAAEDQVIGYNHTLRACFVALASAGEVKLGRYSAMHESYQFEEGMPSFHQLLLRLREATLA